MEDDSPQTSPPLLATLKWSESDRLALRSIIDEELQKIRPSLRSTIDEELQNSTTYKFSKFMFVVVVAVFLVGGSILGLQVKAVSDQARETQREMTATEEKIRAANTKISELLAKNEQEMNKVISDLRQKTEKKEEEFSRFVNERRDKLDKSMSEALKAFEEEKNEVVSSKSTAVAAIESQRAEAKKLLNVENLQELRVVQDKIEALKQATTTLDLRALASIVSPGVWVLLGATVVAIMASLFALARTGFAGGSKK